ncbi:MAG: aldose epimerase family protein [Negativicutes bacterium]|jgi:aldose 1-epimerase
MPEFFGKTADDRDVFKFTLRNEHLTSVEIINFGATVVSVKTPDKNGVFAEITLGFDNCAQWLNNIPYFGAVCGRYCNRINNAKFSLNDKEHLLSVNNGKNNLHGGVDNFSKRLWTVDDYDESFIELSIISPDGDQGFPGEVRLTVRYELTAANELVINYYANTDQLTVVGFTSHIYFNLRDGGMTSILDQELQISADYYVPVNADLIPYGQLKVVDRSPFDFRVAKKIGQDLQSYCEQLCQAGNGYDHCWVVRGEHQKLRYALTLSDRHSGRIMEVFTTEPGIQVYTGNFLNGTIGRNGKKYQNFGGVAIEAEPYPDSPNQPGFPSVQLLPDEKYRQTTIYRFSVNVNDKESKFGEN